MQSLNDIQIKKILAYNIRRAYIGRLTAENLGNAFALIKRSRDWDNPVSQCNLAVGNINGDVICNALWYEMSYNPGRFGDVSPFVFNGRNSIYRFCDKPYGGNLSGKAADVIASIRHHLIEYMNLNHDVCNIQGFIILNCFSYFSVEELELLSTECRMQGHSLLFIESSSVYSDSVFDFCRKIIVDKDGIEIF